jgi:hypothetical protein
MVSFYLSGYLKKIGGGHIGNQSILLAVASAMNAFQIATVSTFPEKILQLMKGYFIFPIFPENIQPETFHQRNVAFIHFQPI